MKAIYFKGANIRSTKLLKARDIMGALQHFKNPLSGNSKKPGLCHVDYVWFFPPILTLLISVPCFSLFPGLIRVLSSYSFFTTLAPQLKLHLTSVQAFPSNHLQT